MKTKEESLARHPFLKGLNPQQLQALADCSYEVSFDQDEYIFHAHEDADRFYLILDGIVALKVHVPNLGPMPIQTVGAGEALGWSWLFPPYKWHFDARVSEPVKAISMDAQSLRELFDGDPKLGYDMMRRVAGVMVHRLQATRLQLLDMYEVRT